MDSVSYRILQQLNDKQYLTAANLSAAAEVSERTVRTRIREIEALLPEHGATIEARPKYGYKLKLNDPAAYKAWLLTISNSRAEISADRVPELLDRLLYQRQYIKIDDLCEEMYVSRNTMSADIKQVEYLLSMYDLSLEKRPNYGIRIIGSEMDRRRCIEGCQAQNDPFVPMDIDRRNKMRALYEIVTPALIQQGLHISEVSLRSLLVYLYIALGRFKKGYFLSLSNSDRQKLEQSRNTRAYLAAQSLADALHIKYNIQFDADEILYLSIHIGSKSSPDSAHVSDANLVISSRIDALVLKMLDEVYNTMGLDLRTNLELRMSLNQHLVPFDVRMIFGITVQNPMLTQFKREYSYAYMVAVCACTVLQGYYGQQIPEDEIGYIGTLFALALEKRNRPVTKKNIIVVCASGRGSSKLFLYRYRQIFGEYINHIYECSVFALPEFDFSAKEIDFVFTTVPLNISVPVPVFEISMFLHQTEVERYRKLFEFDGDSFLHQFYDENLFLPHLAAESKEQVLQLLCEHAARYRSIPNGFYDAVLEREAMAQTDFGNLIAIPHPQRPMTSESFVVVGLLDKPIWWGHNRVSAVFLVSLSENPHPYTEQFYECTTKMLCDDAAIKCLLEKRSFEALIQLLQGK